MFVRDLFAHFRPLNKTIERAIPIVSTPWRNTEDYKARDRSPRVIVDYTLDIDQKRAVD